MRFSAIFLLSCPPGKSHPQVYREGLEQMAAAEAFGFHTLWLTEHHFSAYGGSADPMLMAIAKFGPHGDLTFDELFDSSYIFGTPDECLGMLNELRAMGIEEVICNMNFAGVLEHRQVLHSMELFASKVMPQLG
jgi:alkanesulfonate monooxygenase SsuD/methylene tetrahydromethanopterin reductase-like flavin-dependent oxidoreductase (luciferase family)